MYTYIHMCIYIYIYTHRRGGACVAAAVGPREDPAAGLVAGVEVPLVALA